MYDLPDTQCGYFDALSEFHITEVHCDQQQYKSQHYGLHNAGNVSHWVDLGVDGWIILGWICRRWDVGIWTGLGWPRIGTGGGRL